MNCTCFCNPIVRLIRAVSFAGAVVLMALPPGQAAELLSREGRFIRLTTDLTSAEQADALVESFDAAVPQWLEFWKLPAAAGASWKVDACVIRNKAEFQRQGLLPNHVPDFPFGYALGNRLWILAQPSEYYTRHLLLHEGVHSLAFHQFDGAGPTWFMEGTAELLATHAGQGSQVKVNQIPARREDAPYWGRFKRMSQLRAEKRVPAIETVLGYRPNLRGDVETYGWSWAAVMMLNAYPKYNAALIEAAHNGRDTGPRFNQQLRLRLRADWPVIAARWRLMCHDLDYGFDWSRERVELSTRDPIWNGRSMRVHVSADLGWQSIGVRVAPGTQLRLTPTGRVTLADDPKPWISEPSGVTIRYHRGRPLGQLMICVVPNATKPEGFLQPLQIHTVDQPTTISVTEYCWLLLRVNESVAELSDNQGEYELAIE